MKIEDFEVGDDVLVKLEVSGIDYCDAHIEVEVESRCGGSMWVYSDEIFSGSKASKPCKYKQALIDYAIAMDKVDAAEGDEDLLDDAAEEALMVTVKMRDLGQELIDDEE